jgi:transcriptional regulator with XRE-family HTH domain
VENISYKQIRQLSGLTQEKLAELCEVDRRTVARFENGLSQNSKLQTWYQKALLKTKAEMLFKAK